MPSEITYNTHYPSIADLKRKTKRRIPRFIFDYLEGGSNEDVNLHKNKSEIQAIELMPRYLSIPENCDTRVKLFGHEYDTPFGVAPIGLQGLIWPGSPEILAKAAFDHNIPFILSTVTTTSIEKIAQVTEGKAWFQLYHPVEEKMLDDILERAWDSGIRVLVLLADVPTFGFRPRDIRNGLAMPPNMSLSNFLQIAAKPGWAIRTLLYGQPTFATLKPYVKSGMNLKQFGDYMNKTFDGRLNAQKIQTLRDKWKGSLVLKGIVNEEDLKDCISAGVDGIIVSNHGGRQLDAGESTIKPLSRLARNYSDQLTIMMDGGVRSGPDIARCIASGAKSVFMGRPFMYGVGALGNQGGNHTISLMKVQLTQVMKQLCCEKLEDLPAHLIVN